MATQVNLSTRKLWYGTDAEAQGNIVPPTAGDTLFATDTDIEYTGDGANWIPARSSTDGLSKVLQGISGTFRSATISAIIVPLDVDGNRWADATGCKAFRMRPINGLSTGVTSLVYGFSTAASDFTPLNILCANKIIDVESATPSGISNANVKVITPIEQANGVFLSEDWIVFDGSLTIKTILVRSSGVDQGNIELELLV